MIERAATPPSFFYQPTDVTWGPDGSIFVTDGYGNSRVAKFSRDGNLVKHWGERGTGPGEFLNGFVDTHNPLGHRGTFLNEATPMLLRGPFAALSGEDSAFSELLLRPTPSPSATRLI